MDAALLDPAAAATQAPRQYLCFALGAERHALRIDAVREILEVGQVTPLPLMPPFVHGVMNLRGAVVPVLDLAARLGLAPSQLGRRSCVVVVEARGAEGERPQPMGLLVDAVYEVFDSTAAPEDVPRLGTRIAPQFMRGIVRTHDDAATPELDLDAVLEPHTLAELVARHVATP